MDGLVIEENVFDHNGWARGIPGAHATVFNHNMYLHVTCTNVVTRGNISARASATGASQRCAGVSEDNVFLQNPTGLFYGGDNAAAMPGGRGAARNNVFIDARDIDSENLRGIGMTIAGAANVEVYGNIMSHQRGGSGNVVGFDVGSALKSVTMTRNIVHDWTVLSEGVGMFLDLRRAHGVQATDNCVSQVGGGFDAAWIPSAGAELGGVFGRNVYFTANPPPHQFFYGMLYGDWLESSREVWSSFGPAGFPDAGRDVSSYMASLGQLPTLEAFLALARQQERTAWNPAFTAEAVSAYIRVGFGVTRRGCRADFDDNGTVNIADLMAFQSAAGVGAPSADVDLDGSVTTRDLAMFQSIFTAGCP